jgi:adenylate cyclase class 2
VATANLEIKASCSDLGETRRRARAVATRWVGLDHQVDTYFTTLSGRLKLRESSLSGGQLVPYRRPDRVGPKRADYQVIPVADPAGLKTLLAELLGVHRIVRKEREIALYENVRIHLDRVEGLGCFVELEAVFDGSPAAEAEQEARVRFLMEALGVAEADLVGPSYEALLGEAESRAQAR